MIIKTKDTIEPALSELDRLMTLPGLSKTQRDSIQDKIYALKTGFRGEKDAAYHIDFDLKDSKNWMVIHDLRIEHNGRTAQIDHVLINRFLDIFVIESKNFSTAIRINGDEEFQVKTGWGWKGISSPVEQNNRHIGVLGDLVSDLDLLPKRLGFQIKPVFYNWILVAPECNISGRKGEHTIYKMDMFGKKMKEFRDQEVPFLDIAKIISHETLVNLATNLALHHRPITADYAGKFGIQIPAPSVYEDDRKYQPPSMREVPVEKTRIDACAGCGKTLDAKVVTYCRTNHQKFAGKLLCRECQNSTRGGEKTCDQCSKPVDDKVVAFCRFNSKRFGKRTLCRECQSLVQPATR